MTENRQIFDCIIIGAGPAGLGAAIYAARAGFDVLVIEKSGMPGGQIVNTTDVDNYLGLPGIGGFELGQTFYKHVIDMDVNIVTDMVKSIELDGELKRINCDATTYYSKTVVLAMGAHHAKLGVSGEEELIGKGVSYCATCDGAFFRNKKVVVVGGGDVAVGDALFLSKFCESVTLIHRRDSLRANKSLQDALMAKDNIQIIWNSVVKEIVGTDFVTGVRISDRTSSEEKIIEASGVFIAVGMEPETDLVKELVDLDERGYIIAGEDCKTSVSGILAAGDIRTKNLRQVITAVADGAASINSASEWVI